MQECIIIPRRGEGRCCKTGVVISSTIVIGLNGAGGGERGGKKLVQLLYRVGGGGGFEMTFNCIVLIL